MDKKDFHKLIIMVSEARILNNISIDKFRQRHNLTKGQAQLFIQACQITNHTLLNFADDFLNAGYNDRTRPKYL